MAVPTSGTLSMVKIARERKYSDYNGSQTMGTISMRDLLEGGSAGGSTISYPAVNTNSCNDGTNLFSAAVAIEDLTPVSGCTGCGSSCTVRAIIYDSNGNDVSDAVFVQAGSTSVDVWPGHAIPSLLTFYSNPNTGALLNGTYYVDLILANSGSSGCTGCNHNCGCSSQALTFTNGIMETNPVGTC